MAKNQAYEAFKNLMDDSQRTLQNLLAEKMIPDQFGIRLQNIFLSMRESLNTFGNRLVLSDGEDDQYEEAFIEAFSEDFRKCSGVAADCLNSPSSEEEKNALLGFMTDFTDRAEVSSETTEYGEKIREEASGYRIALSEAEPTRNQVLGWYDSMEETLKDAGIDMDNPVHLLRIKTAMTKDTDDAPGQFSVQKGVIRYAFMRKSPGPENSLKRSYVNPAPAVALEDQEREENLYTVSQNTFAEMVEFRGDLEDRLKKEKRDLKEISRLKDKLDQTREKAVEDQKAYTDFQGEIYEDLDRWLLTNCRKYDREKDYDDIKELYLQAREGKLYINDLVPELAHRRQILVLADGTCGIGPDGKDLTNSGKDPVDSEKHWTPWQLYGHAKTPKIKEKYPGLPEIWTVEDVKKERKIGKRPQVLQVVPEPGIFSWIKRIFTLGRNTDDFDNYEEYRDSVRAAADYDRTMGELIREIRAHNIETLKTCYPIINRERKTDFPEGTVNPAKMMEAQAIFELNDIKHFYDLTEDDLKKEGLVSETYAMREYDHMQSATIEACVNPGSFDEHGNRNVKVSRKYRLEKEFGDPETKKEYARADRALVSAAVAGYQKSEQNRTDNKPHPDPAPTHVEAPELTVTMQI